MRGVKYNIRGLMCNHSDRLKTETYNSDVIYVSIAHGLDLIHTASGSSYSDVLDFIINKQTGSS